MHAGHGSSVQHVHWSRAGWVVQRSCHHCLERGSTGGTPCVLGMSRLFLSMLSIAFLQFSVCFAIVQQHLAL